MEILLLLIIIKPLRSFINNFLNICPLTLRARVIKELHPELYHNIDGSNIKFLFRSDDEVTHKFYNCKVLYQHKGHYWIMKVGSLNAAIPIIDQSYITQEGLLFKNKNKGSWILKIEEYRTER